MTSNISRASLKRLPIYLNYLKTLSSDNEATISATTLANALGFGEVQVRKDLASVSNAGKPKVGYLIADLVETLEDFLCCNEANEAVILGVGKLGRALMEYKGFEEYGMRIVAGFDNNPEIINTEFNGRHIYGVEEMNKFVKDNKTKIGILTIPQSNAQQMADMMIEAGIRAIWNFSRAHITVPKNVALKNENMAVSLAVLSNQLRAVTQEDENEN